MRRLLLFTLAVVLAGIAGLVWSRADGRDLAPKLDDAPETASRPGADTAQLPSVDQGSSNAGDSSPPVRRELETLTIDARL
ncbi:MAG: hypothetical protein KDB80_07725, partial [Planctomycetes bacterium]|nr:hypothetical protein [Planctomycetota bacterium]